jgi:2',3'-cyclic-nucleotide 2'-phosphodiesterase (5'-nucleotidase family)
MQIKLTTLLFYFLSVIVSCNTTYRTHAVQFNDYRISNTRKVDEKLTALIKPYADSVHKSMNAVIAVAEISMETGQSGTLGNLLADVMLDAARKIYKTHVDAAIINAGGLRLSSIAAGNITRGKIFELMPFDNTIVLQKLTGKQLQSLLDHSARWRGWPVAGLTLQIKNKQAVNVKVNNATLDTNAVYTIALPDYLANGGDDAWMLRNVPQQRNGYIFRDAIIDYLSGMHKKGMKISSKKENRVTNAE